MGEKIMSLTKDKFVGFRKNWSKNLLEKVSRTFALERAGAPNQAFCVDRIRDSRMLAKVF